MPPKKRGGKSTAGVKRPTSSDVADPSAKTIKKSKSTKKKVDTTKDSDEEEVQMKTVKIVGKAPVDSECELAETWHVYYEDDDIYDAMLNQTSVQNNNNKYYLMQILQDNVKLSFSVWFRWGRVGKKGQNSLTQCGSDLEKAKKLFTKKFSEKTKNNWEDRSNFEKHAGKYDLLQMDYAADEVDAEKKVAEKLEKLGGKDKIKLPNSKLKLELKNLIELIFDIRAMEETVAEMKYNAKKAPLGKLTVKQIKAGYEALKAIEECVLKDDTGTKLTDACNEFYTRIPHDFGMKRPPLIRSVRDIREKMDLLEALSDIQIAMTILNEESIKNENPADSHYSSLNCQIEPLDKKIKLYQTLDQYLQNTHAKTHSNYKLELLDVFECQRSEESKKFKDLGNRMLLWHGSRLTNSVGILKQGLRIAPPEAPCTGYMFGKGVYFADMSSKSANYCYPNRSQSEGIMYLCEVALGKPRKLLDADSDGHKLPKGFHSVMGQGSIAPDPKKNQTLPNGTIVPLGEGVDTGVKNPRGYTLNYNEYIVYNTEQIQIKYLLRVKFHFNM